MLQLRKHLAPLLRATCHRATVALSSSIQRHALFLSTSAPPSTPTPFSLEEYLVATCGLNRAGALKASKKIRNLDSASNPDAVLALFSGVGLSRPDIAAVVAADPLLLRSRVGNIAPRLASLRDRLGLSDPEIRRFLLAGGARALRSCDVAAKLDFWIPFYGSFEKLLRIMRRNNALLVVGLEKAAKPNISQLEQRGLSVCDIAKLSITVPWLLMLQPKRVEELLQRIEKLGIPHTSSRFKCAVGVAGCVNEDKAALRLEFLKSITGCSMEKVRLAVCRMPTILALSQDNLRRKIEFLVTEVRLEAAYILENPVLLTYNLEKRMVPRHHVLKILQDKGLIKKRVGFLHLFFFGEDVFIARYIDCYKGTVSGLADAYASARAGDMPAIISLSSL